MTEKSFSKFSIIAEIFYFYFQIYYRFQQHDEIEIFIKYIQYLPTFVANDVANADCCGCKLGAKPLTFKALAAV
jgi:hypothetical protein